MHVTGTSVVTVAVVVSVAVAVTVSGGSVIVVVSVAVSVMVLISVVVLGIQGVQGAPGLGVGIGVRVGFGCGCGCDGGCDGFIEGGGTAGYVGPSGSGAGQASSPYCALTVIRKKRAENKKETSHRILISISFQATRTSCLFKPILRRRIDRSTLVEYQHRGLLINCPFCAIILFEHFVLKSHIFLDIRMRPLDSNPSQRPFPGYILSCENGAWSFRPSHTSQGRPNSIH